MLENPNNPNNSLIHSFRKFLVILIYISTFTFATFHVSQLFHDSIFLRFKIPIVNGNIIYFLISILFISTILTEPKKILKFDTFDLCFICLIVWQFLSLLWSINIANALAINLMYLACYIFYRSILEDAHKLFRSKTLHYGLPAMLLILFFHYLFSNYQLLLILHESNVNYNSIIKRSMSFLGSKNQTGCFLALLFPLVVYNVLKRKSILNNFVLACLFFFILISGCRNAYIGVIIYLFLFLVYSLNSRVNTTRINIKRTILTSLIFVSIFTFFLFAINPANFQNRIFHNSTDSRLMIWKNTIGMFNDSGILGFGTAQWDSYKLMYGISPHYLHPHNDVLRTLMENGLIGFVLYYSLFFIAFKRLWKVYRDTEWKLEVLTVFSFLFLFLFQSLIDEMKIKLNFNILLMLIFAITTGLSKSLKRENQNLVLINKVFPKGVLIGAFALLSYIFSVQWNNIQLDRYEACEKESTESVAKVECLKQFDNVNKHIINNINGKSLHIIKADIFLKNGDIDSAHFYYHKNEEYILNYIKIIELQMLDQNYKQWYNGLWFNLAKLYCMDPCQSLDESTYFDIPKTPDSEFYRSIIEKQKAKCR